MSSVFGVGNRGVGTRETRTEKGDIAVQSLLQVLELMDLIIERG